MSSSTITPRKKIPFYIITSLLASLGGLINGYDTGAIGAITSMTSFHSTIGALSPTQLGFTVSLIMLGGVVPCFFAGALSDRFGRLRVIAAGSLVFTVGAAIQGLCRSWPAFLVGRLVAGLGEGVYLGTMAVYICEIAPSSIRGILAGLPQFQSTLGICVGYFTCYASVHIQSSLSWRLPYLFQVLLGLALTGICLRLPDSPRWLVLHARREEALTSVKRLDLSLAEAERDIFRSLPSGDGQSHSLALSPWSSFTLCFRRPCRSRTILALFVLGMVQLSGIDGVLYYAPTLFSQAGLSSKTSTFLASGLSSILMLAISVPAFLLSDRWGRRTSALAGGVGLAGCMFGIGALYAAGAVHTSGPGKWLVVLLVFAFGLVYCATWGIVGKIYASEIQPAHTRAAANTLAQGLGFLTNWLVAVLTPVLLATSAFGAYFLFGGLALGTVAVLAALMPETKGRSLESIQEAFQRPAGGVVSNVLGGVRRRMTRGRNGTGASSGSSSGSVGAGRSDVARDAEDAVSMVSLSSALRDGPSVGGGVGVGSTGVMRLDLSAA